MTAGAQHDKVFECVEAAVFAWDDVMGGDSVCAVAEDADSTVGLFGLIGQPTPFFGAVVRGAVRDFVSC
jgi:hypothetical protein